MRFCIPGLHVVTGPCYGGTTNNEREHIMDMSVIANADRIDRAVAAGRMTALTVTHHGVNNDHLTIDTEDLIHVMALVADEVVLTTVNNGIVTGGYLDEDGVFVVTLGDGDDMWRMFLGESMPLIVRPR